jgi:hypothetical protein
MMKNLSCCSQQDILTTISPITALSNIDNIIEFDNESIALTCKE